MKNKIVQDIGNTVQKEYVSAMNGKGLKILWSGHLQMGIMSI